MNTEITIKSKYEDVTTTLDELEVGNIFRFPASEYLYMKVSSKNHFINVNKAAFVLQYKNDVPRINEGYEIVIPFKAKITIELEEQK